MSSFNPFSSSPSSPDSPSGNGSSQSSAEVKSTIVNHVQSKQAMDNARVLIQSITENCFEKCITSPDSSLSPKDKTCLNTCMEKYIGLWNSTSRAYIARAGREKPAGAEALGALPSGEGLM